MAPKGNQKLQSSILVMKPFYISADSLCQNKRLKRRRLRTAETLRSYHKIVHNFNSRQNHQRIQSGQSLEQRRERQRRFERLEADVTIDLLSDDEPEDQPPPTITSQQQQQQQVNHELDSLLRPNRTPHSRSMLKENKLNNNCRNWPRLDAERARILGLMPVTCLPAPPLAPPPALPKTAAASPKIIKKRRKPAISNNGEKRVQMPDKSCRRQPPPPMMSFSNEESIILSDDSEDEAASQTAPRTERNPMYTLYPCQETFQRLQNSIQVDEVTVSLIPRAMEPNSSSPTSSSPLDGGGNSQSHYAMLDSTPFPMLPDETVVQTVIANRVYELSLDKLREGLASSGFAEFGDDEENGSSRKCNGNNLDYPALANLHTQAMEATALAPGSLKLSSDLSISLISDDDDDEGNGGGGGGSGHKQHTHNHNGVHQNNNNNYNYNNHQDENNYSVVRVGGGGGGRGHNINQSNRSQRSKRQKPRDSQESLLHKLPLNVSISQIPSSNRVSGNPRRKLG